VRTLEYNKTKTTVLYSKHKILEIPHIFKLFVAKFMYSFYNGGLLNHSDNYFAEIASVHKYQTRLASLQKYYLPRMKTTLGQLSLKYTGPKTGPVLSRFDRFLPIRPRAEGGPAPLNQHKVSLCIEAGCECFRRGIQCFSRSFETKTVLKLFQRSLKTV